MNVPEPLVKEAASSLEDQRIVHEIQAYQAALGRGEDPGREGLLARFPELRAEIAGCLDGLELICRVAPQLRDEEGEGPTSAYVTDQLSTRTPIGDFRIEREIGRGGMGVVYEAEQMSLGRRVALKVLPFAAIMDDRHLQRFKNEAQAAAHLHHTNIVPVYFVGCDRGVHHYAMQYIEGLTVAQTIEELRVLENGRGDQAPSSDALAAITGGDSSRSTSYCRAVARLGVQAALALDHAHQRGVVHRDVKPANLIIDASGNLWVTDFGLASFADNPDLTMTGDVLGTARYMSPEQALGKRADVDARTDTYSLGVTLYEFLTLKPANVGEDRAQVVQEILEKDPPLARKLNAAVPAELETILLKAMAKDPAERYETAGELADDLTRFLENKPIAAKRPGLVKRAGKWARRHKGVVWAAAVVLLLSAVAFGISAWRTRGVLARAESSLRFAQEAVDRFLTEVGTDPFGEQTLTPSRRRLLEKALEFSDTYLLDRSDPAAHHNRGRILYNLERYEEARAAHAAALALDDTYISAWIGLGATHARLGEYEKGLEAYRRCLAIDADVASVHYGKANALRALKRNGEALAAYNRAIAIDPDHRAHNNRILVLTEMGKHDEAMAAIDEAIAAKPRSVILLHNKGEMLRAGKKWEEALDTFDKVLDIDKRYVPSLYSYALTLRSLDQPKEALKAFDRLFDFDDSIPYAHMLRAHSLCELGNHEGARASYACGLELSPEDPDFQFNIGKEYWHLRQFENAAKAFTSVLELDPKNWKARFQRGKAFAFIRQFEKALRDIRGASEQAPGHPEILLELGRMLAQQGRPDDAISELDAAIRVDPNFVPAYVLLGTIRSYRGDHTEAVHAFRQALRIDDRRAPALNALAWLLATCPDPRHRDPQEAVRLAKRAVSIAGHWVHMRTLGIAHCRARNWGDAVTLLEKCTHLSKGRDGVIWFGLAMAQWQSNQKKKANESYERAVAWMEENAPQDEELARFRNEAAELLRMD